MTRFQFLSVVLVANSYLKLFFGEDFRSSKEFMMNNMRIYQMFSWFLFGKEDGSMYHQFPNIWNFITP